MQHDPRALCLAQAALYPALTVQDAVKALYQQEFGCGHLLRDPDRALAFLAEEARTCHTPAGRDIPLTEPLFGDFCRVHLQALPAAGLTPATLGRLFRLSAQEKCGDTARFLASLDTLEGMITAGELPLPADAARAYLTAYRAAGCPAERHSESFRSAYAPAYRVIRAEYAPLLPLFGAIDRLLAASDAPVTVALDGPSASGKTSLAALLAQVYGCSVFHMDDFFLQPAQRTPARLQEPGGNVDRERFLAEVLTPLASRQPFTWRPFDCGTMSLGAPAEARPTRLVIVEGVYSLHPELRAAYDLTVFLTIGREEQSARILRRNGPEMHRRFLTEWIPMEDRYFSVMGIADASMLRIARDGR